MRVPGSPEGMDGDREGPDPPSCSNCCSSWLHKRHSWQAAHAPTRWSQYWGGHASPQRSISLCTSFECCERSYRIVYVVDLLADAEYGRLETMMLEYICHTPQQTLSASVTQWHAAPSNVWSRRAFHPQGRMSKATASSSAIPRSRSWL